MRRPTHPLIVWSRPVGDPVRILFEWNSRHWLQLHSPLPQIRTEIHLEAPPCKPYMYILPILMSVYQCVCWCVFVLANSSCARTCLSSCVCLYYREHVYACMRASEAVSSAHVCTCAYMSVWRVLVRVKHKLWMLPGLLFGRPNECFGCRSKLQRDARFYGMPELCINYNQPPYEHVGSQALLRALDNALLLYFSSDHLRKLDNSPNYAHPLSILHRASSRPLATPLVWLYPCFSVVVIPACHCHISSSRPHSRGDLFCVDDCKIVHNSLHWLNYFPLDSTGSRSTRISHFSIILPLVACLPSAQHDLHALLASPTMHISTCHMLLVRLGSLHASRAFFLFFPNQHNWLWPGDPSR
ncbi:unnamed protein product [Protopolystoma xenopodis]|uniref:Uncharacterized protein n=1 Tax=Protopolystoma xenopodis TaxID=117903 RepID=A0A448XPE7_9PLAT|nr:unnamed protein product [Protopolystoma xenopodis]